MKVKCINKKGWIYGTLFLKKKWPWSKRQNKPADGPKFDDIVTVEEEKYCDGEKCYRLVEWPYNGLYLAKLFQPIDDNQYKDVTFSKIKETMPALSEN